MQKTLKHFKVFLKYLKPYKKEIKLFVLLGVLAAILNSLAPLLVGRFLDALAFAADGGDMALAYKLLLIWFVVYTLSVFITWLTRRITTKIEYKSDVEFNAKAMRILLAMPMSFRKEQKTGKIRYKIEVAAGRIGWFTNLFFNQYTIALFGIFSGLFMSFYISVPLASILLFGM